MDCGGLLDLDPDLGRLNSRCAILGLGRLGLKVAGVTPRDLFYGVEFLTELADSAGINLVSGNLIDAGTSRRLFPDWAVLQTAGGRIAVTSLAAYKPERRINGIYGWSIVPPDSLLGINALEIPAGVDFTVLLTDMEEGALRELLAIYQEFDVAASSNWLFQTGGAFKVGKTLVIHPPQDGKELNWVAVDWSESAANRTQYFNQPVPQTRRMDRSMKIWLENCLGRSIK